MKNSKHDIENGQMKMKSPPQKKIPAVLTRRLHGIATYNQCFLPRLPITSCYFKQLHNHF